MSQVEVGEPQGLHAPGRPRVHREVVSYVRRSARMRPHQREAWEAHRGAYVVEVERRETSTSVAPQPPLDLAAAFGRVAPLVVEIGPGTGESVVELARARPELDILAFEVYQPAIAQILARLVARGVGNVRVVEADAQAGLAHLLPPGSVEELWTFFPDPWPKARHHKRRLVDAEFARLAASRLRPGGRWRLATDWIDYAEQMRTTLAAEPTLLSSPPDNSDGWAPRWADRPLSRFESRGLAAGREVYDLCYERAR